MEHRLLTAWVSLSWLIMLSQPRCASAQMLPQYSAFGAHGANSNLVAQPIGAAECETPIVFLFSPTTTSSTTRFIDIWSAVSTSAGCQTGAIRSGLSAYCTHVGSRPFVSTDMTATVSLTPVDLFGTCETVTRTFYFFDTLTSDDVSSSFATYWVLTATLSASAPVAPIITSTPVGDATLQIPWNASEFPSIEALGQVWLFAEPGCAGVDGGTTTLVAGGTAPSTPLFRTGIHSPIVLDTTLLGWSASHDGEASSLAIAAVDSAGNVSVLSNIVCAQHVAPVRPSSSCSVALRGGRGDLGALGFALVSLAAVVRRRARRA